MFAGLNVDNCEHCVEGQVAIFMLLGDPSLLGMVFHLYCPFPVSLPRGKECTVPTQVREELFFCFCSLAQL